MFWRLLVGTVIMLAFGYCGEASFINAWPAFILGLCGWFFILFEVFQGEAGQVAGQIDKVSDTVQSSFQTMRIIVTAGWCIYPLGYLLGYLLGAVRDDVLNKIAFCLAIWASAVKDASRGSNH